VFAERASSKNRFWRKRSPRSMATYVGRRNEHGVQISDSGYREFPAQSAHRRLDWVYQMSLLDKAKVSEVRVLVELRY